MSYIRKILALSAASIISILPVLSAEAIYPSSPEYYATPSSGITYYGGGNPYYHSYHPNSLNYSYNYPYSYNSPYYYNYPYYGRGVGGDYSQAGYVRGRYHGAGNHWRPHHTGSWRYHGG